MELKSNQIVAVASKIYQELITAYNDKVSTIANKKQKLIEAKLNLKANSVLKEFIIYNKNIKNYVSAFIQSKYESDFEAINKEKVKMYPSLDAIRNEIIISTIDMKDIKEIMDSVKRKFS